MGIVLCAVACVVCLAIGAGLGVMFANSRHKAQRGQILGQTLRVAREIIYSEMASQEFHMAVMSVVHPDAVPNDGYEMIQVAPNGQMIVDADQWLGANVPQPRRSKSRRQVQMPQAQKSWLPWRN